MLTHETDRGPEDTGAALLAEPGDDVALGCESAMPFLTPGADRELPGETRPWAPPLAV